MTRNEALDKIKSFTKRDAGEWSEWIDILEVLGLIKFDEEKIVDSPQMIIANHIRGYTPQPTIKAGNIVNSLMDAGYKIIYPEKPK